MTITVPKRYAETLRNRRLAALSFLTILSFALAEFYKPEFEYAGYPLIVYICIIVLTYNLPLMYRIATGGVYLTTQPRIWAAPLSLATNFWICWVFDRVTNIQHTHYEGVPALSIRTRFNPRGTLLPIGREDIAAVAALLQPARSETGANAFS